MHPVHLVVQQLSAAQAVVHLLQVLCLGVRVLLALERVREEQGCVMQQVRLLLWHHAFIWGCQTKHAFLM